MKKGEIVLVKHAHKYLGIDEANSPAVVVKVFDDGAILAKVTCYRELVFQPYELKKRKRTKV